MAPHLSSLHHAAPTEAHRRFGHIVARIGISGYCGVQCPRPPASSISADAQCRRSTQRTIDVGNPLRVVSAVTTIEVPLSGAVRG